jgi:hypothetical protein
MSCLTAARVHARRGGGAPSAASHRRSFTAVIYSFRTQTATAMPKIPLTLRLLASVLAVLAIQHLPAARGEGEGAVAEPWQGQTVQVAPTLPRPGAPAPHAPAVLMALPLRLISLTAGIADTAGRTCTGSTGASSSTATATRPPTAGRHSCWTGRPGWRPPGSS